MGAYKPTANDVAWMKRLWSHLKVGGLWSYGDSSIVVQRLSEDSAAIVAFKPEGVEVERLMAVLAVCNISAIVITKTLSYGGGEGYGSWN